MARQPGTYAKFDTSEGTIVCRLFDKEAPKTVQNFIDLAEGKRDWNHPITNKKSRDRLYDGTIFHRIIPNFNADAEGITVEQIIEKILTLIPRGKGDRLL